MKSNVSPRIPVAPPGFAMKTDRDYDRSRFKREAKKRIDDE